MRKLQIDEESMDKLVNSEEFKTLMDFVGMLLDACSEYKKLNCSKVSYEVDFGRKQFYNLRTQCSTAQMYNFCLALIGLRITPQDFFAPLTPLWEQTFPNCKVDKCENAGFARLTLEEVVDLHEKMQKRNKKNNL